MKTIEETCKI